MKRLLLLILSILPLGLLGCASVQVADYAAERPKLDLRTYFDGKLVAYGVVQDRSGRVIRRMRVDMTATWSGNTLTLDEDFTYADGTKEKRVWTIVKDGDRYTGTAADVVGEARGEASGNALNWRYVLRLPEAQGGWTLDFDDWMWLIDERVMVNRAVFSKFGIRFGEVIITFVKQP
ncbi:MAG: DUF3833 domain-containing protein [Casimicrobiaceae bacterium]|nr:DUF3833 domain-containing protein [Casimicrobiaceae bacterium]MDW8313016.1 DUF3833 domain-containing protein [Burkholderiales bacterium]